MTEPNLQSSAASERPEQVTIQQTRPTRRHMTWALLGLLIVSVSIIGTYIPDQRELSVFDEWVFLDYVDQVTNLNVAQRGEQVTGEALEVLSCRGVQYYGTIGSPCGGPYDPLLYPQGGITAADVHPPTYFALTAAGAAVIRGLGISDDLLTSSRMMGAAFLFVGLIGIVLLALDLGARLPAAVGAASVVAALPLTRYTNSYITPDNLNLAAGSFILLAAVRFRRNIWPWWPLAVASAAAGLVKTQNGLAVGAAVIFLVWSALTVNSRPMPSARKHLAAGAAALGAFFGVQLLWQAIRAATAVGSVPDQGVLGPLTSGLLVRETAAFLLDLGLRVTDDRDPTISYFLTGLLVAGCVGALLYLPSTRRMGCRCGHHLRIDRGKSGSRHHLAARDG